MQQKAGKQLSTFKVVSQSRLLFSYYFIHSILFLFNGCYRMTCRDLLGRETNIFRSLFFQAVITRVFVSCVVVSEGVGPSHAPLVGGHNVAHIE